MQHLSACLGLSEADLHYIGTGPVIAEYAVNGVANPTETILGMVAAKEGGLPVTVERPAWDVGTTDEEGNTVYAVDLEAAQQALDALTVWQEPSPITVPTISLSADYQTMLDGAGISEEVGTPE